MIELMIFAGYMGVLCVGGLVADYIFPRIKPLERYIDSLPMMREENTDGQS